MLTVENWRGIHTRILVLTAKGHNRSQVAKAVKMSDRQVGRIMREGIFMAKLARLSTKTTDLAERKFIETEAERTLLDRARDELLKSALQAARTIKRLSRQGTSKERLMFDACRDILDRVGLKPKEVIETHERVYTPEEVDSALKTVNELESIVTRLTNQESSFVVQPDTVDGTTASSVTDKGSAMNVVEDLPAIPVDEAPSEPVDETAV